MSVIKKVVSGFQGPPGAVKLAGEAGQFLGFDENGEARALTLPPAILAPEDRDILDAVPHVAELPEQLAAPFIQPAKLTQGRDEVDLPTGYLSQIDIRHFGARMTAFDEAPTDAVAEANLIALQEAIDWASHTGGMVAIPSGSLDIFGTAIWQIGAAMRGNNQHSSRIRQRQIARSLNESYADVLRAAPVAGNAGGTGYTWLSDLTIDGGWNLRDFENQTGVVNWAHDPSRMTQVGIYYDTPPGGSGASATRAASSDPHNRLTNMVFTHIAGTAVDMRGRGENFIRGLEVRYAGKDGVHLASPDCFVSGLTSYLAGDNGIRIGAASGNLRFEHSKFWFCGMQRAVEPIGAGVLIPDAGTQQLYMVGVCTQDTWGAGLDISGSYGLHFMGQIDEAGGGRVSQQRLGYDGPRTLPRACIRGNGTLRHADIQATITGGGRNGAANRPALVHLRGSGNIHSTFKLNGDLTNISATRVVEDAGSANAKRHNEVWFGRRLIHGYVSAAQIADPSHGVNDIVYGPTIVFRDDGAVLVRGRNGEFGPPPPAA